MNFDILTVDKFGHPLHRKNMDSNLKKNTEFGHFAKTQGISYAEVVNSLIPKIQWPGNHSKLPSTNRPTHQRPPLGLLGTDSIGDSIDNPID